MPNINQTQLNAMIAQAMAVAAGSAPVATAPVKRSTDLSVDAGSFVSTKGATKGQTVKTLTVYFAGTSPYGGVSKSRDFWAAVAADIQKGSSSAIVKALSGK